MIMHETWLWLIKKLRHEKFCGIKFVGLFLGFYLLIYLFFLEDLQNLGLREFDKTILVLTFCYIFKNYSYILLFWGYCFSFIDE